MRQTVRRWVLAAGLMLGWAATAPLAAQTDIQLTVELPASVAARDLRWGAMQAGVEVGQGRRDLTTLTSTGDVPATFPAQLDVTLTADSPPVRVWFCINRDDYDRYVPSFGDTYQIVPLIHGEQGWQAQAKRPTWQTRKLSAPDNLLTIHYHRVDDIYDSVGVWTWDEHQQRTPPDNEIHPVGQDAFGLVFQLDTGRYGKAGDGVGLLPRRRGDWQHKDGGDRLWRPQLGRTVYLVQEDDRLYSEVPDVTPKVRRVTLDADHNLTIRFSHRLPVADWTPDKFKVVSSSGRQLQVTAVHPFRHRGDRSALFSIEVREPFQYPQEAYALEVQGFDTQNVVAGHIVKDPNRFYDADARMGATYTPQQTTFRVFAPGALAAWVVVADEVEGDAGRSEHVMSCSDKGIWSVEVSGDLAGKYYAYKLGGVDFDKDREITDIYATCTQARHARSLIVDLDQTDPPGFDDYTYRGPMSPADAVIYELHVRDFTIAPESGVQHKGKYLGLTEAGTTLPDATDVKTGLDHLVEMGVTHVQIMPIQDFDNNETANDGYNWGYMPVHFNSPDGWYASEPMGAGKIRELKQAIKAFHDRGIGVILDVVYNHTAGCAAFNQLVPGYYFRLTDAGNFSNGSGCGNEFASEHPMARKFILDSLKYWVTEYKFDGFRFDLMGLIDLETLKLAKGELYKLNPGILVYGEPWTGGHTPLKPITDKHQVRMSGLSAFNDGFRDAIKGDRDGGGPGFIQTGERTGDVVKGLMGAIHDWSHDPAEAIAYFEAHDNLTAWDKLLQSVPEGSDEVRRRMMRFAACILFTAQGMPFIQAGQEMCRSKQGNSNSYNQPDAINQVDWTRKQQYADVVEYHKGMIALRKAHPAFRLRTRPEVETRVRFATPPDGRCIEYHIHAAGLEGESAERIIVLLNGATEPIAFTLPEGSWQVMADAYRAGAEPLSTASARVMLPPHSGMVLLR